MKENSNIRYQMSLLCFLLCSSVIYNPLYKSSRPILCCIFSLVFGLIISALYLRVFNRAKVSSDSASKRLLCTIAFISVCLGSVFFIGKLTENFAAFSPFYDSEEKNLVFAILLLFTCAYVSHGKPDGIFRFCQLILPSMLFYYIILFFAPITTKNIILPPKSSLYGVSPEGLIQALLSSLYLFSDMAVFHFAFDTKNTPCSSNKKLFAKQSILSVFIFSFIMIINRTRAGFTFGEALVRDFSFCDLAAIKLLPFFSFPEIYLVFISLACTVKISVYLRSASKLLSLIFRKNHLSGFKNDSYICAFFCLALSIFGVRLLSSFAPQNALFIVFLPLSSFFITLFCILSSKRQNKS